MDFGLVKLLDPADPRTSSSMQGMGTLPYSADGADRRRRAHRRASDLYALGATLYYLLTGVLPADAPQRLLNPGAGRAGLLAPALSPVTEAAVLKAMALGPDQRFQTAQEMRAALSAARSPAAAPAGPQPPAAQCRSPSPASSLLLRGCSLKTVMIGLLLLTTLIWVFVLRYWIPFLPSHRPPPLTRILHAKPLPPYVDGHIDSRPGHRTLVPTPTRTPTATPTPTDTPTAMPSPTPRSS